MQKQEALSKPLFASLDGEGKSGASVYMQLDDIYRRNSALDV
jgi:hypothetical protein